MEKAILIISTDATRTGTPILLLSHLKWLKKNSQLKFILLLREGGELLGEFESLTDVFLWNKILENKINKSRLMHLASRVLKKIFRIKKEPAVIFTRKLKQQYDIRLIYSNSSRGGDILPFFTNNYTNKILTYVHEGEKTLNLWNTKGKVSYNLKISNELIAVSEAVKKTLTEKFNVTQPITVIPGAIDPHQTINNKNTTLLETHRIPKNSAIVMSCGWLGWHKGIDFFIQVARILLTNNNQPLHFVWVGGNEDDEAYKQLKFDIDKLNLGEHISLITSKANILEYLNLADIFLMLSREESFSLVTAEAGLLKKPALCFEGSGGPCEIINFDKRFMVPFADINKMVEKITYLLEHRDEAKQMGEFLYSRVINNYTIEKTATKLLSVVEEMIKE